MIQVTQTEALYQPIGVGWEEGSRGRDICIPMGDPC